MINPHAMQILYTTFSQFTETSMDKMRNSVTLEGLPGGRVEGPRFLLSLFPSKIPLCSLFLPFFPLFVPCLIYLPTTFPHHQHRSGGSNVPTFPKTGSCSLRYFSFVPLFSNGPGRSSPWALTICPNGRPYRPVCKFNSSVSSVQSERLLTKLIILPV